MSAGTIVEGLTFYVSLSRELIDETPKRRHDCFLYNMIRLWCIVLNSQYSLHAKDNESFFKIYDVF